MVTLPKVEEDRWHLGRNRRVPLKGRQEPKAETVMASMNEYSHVAKGQLPGMVLSTPRKCNEFDAEGVPDDFDKCALD